MADKRKQFPWFGPLYSSRHFSPILQAEMKAKQAEPEQTYMDYSYDQPGSTPGTLQIEVDAPQPELMLIDYNDDNAIRQTVSQPEVCTDYLDTASVTWVDVQGLGSEEILRRLGTVFDLHPLVLEDVVNVPQRPKVEAYDDQLVIIARMVTPKKKELGFFLEQVSLILSQNYLVTLQEEPLRDCFWPVRDRIRMGRGIIRNQKADYLAYALLDAIVDGFFPVLEDYGEYIEELEDEVLINPSRQTIEKIHDLKRELMILRRAIWPQRNAISALMRETNEFVSPEVRVYLRDCYDHAVQVLEIVETYRELASSLMDVYMSSVGNRMNEVMKILTVVSSIFIPLSFIVGLYGMNFDTTVSPFNMPELSWYWGYPFCWGVMVTISSGLLFFFWRRGWFENFSTLGEKR